MITELLKQYVNLNGKEREDLEDKIWQMYGKQGAVAIWDMSDFTRITQERGIIYFLSLIESMKLNCKPIIDQHNGITIRILADDIFASFDNLNDALNCALDVRKWCDSQTDIEMSCGISYGKFLEIRDENDQLINIFGDPVNKAFRLGEDVADNGQILIDTGEEVICH